MTTEPTRCCVLTQKGTRCANEPSPVRPSRMIGPVRIAACGLEAHQRALWSLPGFVRHDAYCGAFGCDRPSNAGICPKHRDQYRDFGITEYALLAQGAPMTEPITPPAEPKESAGVGAPSVAAHLAAITKIEQDLRDRRDAVATRLLSAGFEMEYGTLQTAAYRKGDLLVSLPMDDRGLSLSEFERRVVGAELVAPTAIISALLKDAAEMATTEPHPLETRRDRLIATLLGAGFEEKPAISGRVRRFAYCNDYWVIVPNGPAAESQEDFARALDTAEAALKRLTSTVDAPHLPVAPAPADDGEPSVGDVADAPLFVGGTDTAPLDGLAALAARGQPPVAPGPTVAELQAELKEATRLSECRRKEVQRRGDALARMEVLLEEAEADAERERKRANEADGLRIHAETDLIGERKRAEDALESLEELRNMRSTTRDELHAVCLLMQRLGSYGSDASAMLMRLLPMQSRRALLEIEAADARGELARARANVVSPPTPEKLAEYAAKVAEVEAKIAALAHLPDAGKMVQG